MEECQNLINKVRSFRHSKVRGRQINKFNRLVDKQGKEEGRLANSANTPDNHQQGRKVGSGCNPHPGLCPSTGNAATSAHEDSHNSQMGDVAGSTWDQGLRPRVMTAAGQLQPHTGLPHPQCRPSRATPPALGVDKLDDPNHRWVKHLSNTPQTQAHRSLLAEDLTIQ